MKSKIAMVLIMCLCASSWAHSGRTDSNGCHTDQSTGQYHCHNSGNGSGTAITVVVVVIVLVATGFAIWYFNSRGGKGDDDTTKTKKAKTKKAKKTKYYYYAVTVPTVYVVGMERVFHTKDCPEIVDNEHAVEISIIALDGKYKECKICKPLKQ